jgi:hypothetical protein
MPPLTFEDPPPAKRGPYSAITDADRTALRKRSGQWALIYTGGPAYAYKLASLIRKSERDWAGHTWEAVTRRQPDRKTAKVYARHIAPAQEK